LHLSLSQSYLTNKKPVGFQKYHRLGPWPARFVWRFNYHQNSIGILK